MDRLLVPGGFVILHDTIPRESGWLGPAKIIQQILESEDRTHHVIQLPTPSEIGLAVI